MVIPFEEVWLWNRKVLRWPSASFMRAHRQLQIHHTKGRNHAGNLPVGGIDALQSIRLAVDMLDALIKTRPSAKAYGITGRF